MELTLDDAVEEQAVAALYRQIFAVLGRTAESVISDQMMVDLAETLFAAFSDAGSDGLTMEQMRRTCRGYPDAVFDSRVRVLRQLGAIERAFDRPNQQVYRASFASYVSLLFIRRMLTRGGQVELHRMLALERLNLDEVATEQEARGSAERVTNAFRLIVTELFMLMSGGTIDALREKAPLLWNAESLISEAAALHDMIVDRWPALTRPCGELRAAVASYRDVSNAAAARLTQSAGTTRALDLLPAETWRTFARTAAVERLAAPLARLVFDAPRIWQGAGEIAEAIAQTERPNVQRPRPPRASTLDAVTDDADLVDGDSSVLRERAETVLEGSDSVDLGQLLGGCGDWPTARRLLSDLTAAANHPDLPYELMWADGLSVQAVGPVSWLPKGRFVRASAVPSGADAGE
ncbi:MAG: hypothetical protein ACRDT4_01025 [Micromonosporaceae bacterium]